MQTRRYSFSIIRTIGNGIEKIHNKLSAVIAHFIPESREVVVASGHAPDQVANLEQMDLKRTQRIKYITSGIFITAAAVILFVAFNAFAGALMLPTALAFLSLVLFYAIPCTIFTIAYWTQPQVQIKKNFFSRMYDNVCNACTFASEHALEIKAFALSQTVKRIIPGKFGEYLGTCVLSTGVFLNFCLINNPIETVLTIAAATGVIFLAGLGIITGGVMGWPAILALTFIVPGTFFLVRQLHDIYNEKQKENVRHPALDTINDSNNDSNSTSSKEAQEKTLAVIATTVEAVEDAVKAATTVAVETATTVVQNATATLATAVSDPLAVTGVLMGGGRDKENENGATPAIPENSPPPIVTMDGQPPHPPEQNSTTSPVTPPTTTLPVASTNTSGPVHEEALTTTTATVAVTPVTNNNNNVLETSSTIDLDTKTAAKAEALTAKLNAISQTATNLETQITALSNNLPATKTTAHSALEDSIAKERKIISDCDTAIDMFTTSLTKISEKNKESVRSMIAEKQNKKTAAEDRLKEAYLTLASHYEPYIKIKRQLETAEKALSALCAEFNAVSYNYLSDSCRKKYPALDAKIRTIEDMVLRINASLAEKIPYQQAVTEASKKAKLESMALRCSSMQGRW